MELTKTEKRVFSELINFNDRNDINILICKNNKIYIIQNNSAENSYICNKEKGDWVCNKVDINESVLLVKEMLKEVKEVNDDNNYDNDNVSGISIILTFSF